jgi:hypothetical protein
MSSLPISVPLRRDSLPPLLPGYVSPSTWFAPVYRNVRALGLLEPAGLDRLYVVLNQILRAGVHVSDDVFLLDEEMPPELIIDSLSDFLRPDARTCVRRAILAALP